MLSAEKVYNLIGKTNVHIDFHTPDWQPSVGENFDAESFAKKLVDCNVDSVTVFAKDYCGMSYYPTKYGVMHPGLDYDMLKVTVDACRKYGVKVLVYFSCALDTAAGDAHPDWLMVDVNGVPYGGYASRKANWVCFNTPYIEESLLPQIKEVVDNYDIDGLYFDELFYQLTACSCHYCKDKMARQGLNPQDPDHVRMIRNDACLSLAGRITRLVESYENRDIAVTYNATNEIVGIGGELAKLQNIICVGGHEVGHVYLNMALEARYVRNLGRPVMAHDGLFHHRWGDFGTIRSQHQLRYELGEMLSHHFPISIGDHMLPDGSLEEPKYMLMKEEFTYVKSLDLPLHAWPARDIAVLAPGLIEAGYAPRRKDRVLTHGSTQGTSKVASAQVIPDYIVEGVISNPYQIVPSKAYGYTGAVKLLSDTHQQFDLIDDNNDIDYGQFQVIILAEVGGLSETATRKLRAYVDNGGCIVASGDATLVDGKFELEDVFGVRYERDLPYTDVATAFFDLLDYKNGVPDLPMKAYSKLLGVVPLPDTEVKAGLYGPFATDRRYTAAFRGGPAERPLDYPGITLHRFGKGTAIYIASDIFMSYYETAYYAMASPCDKTR